LFVNIEDTNSNQNLYVTGYNNTLILDYNCTTGTWFAHLNYGDKKLTDTRVPISGGGFNLTSSNFYNLNPRIETFYNLSNEGIKISSIEYQFYKRVRNNTEFENYKEEISSYKFGKYNDFKQISFEDLLTTQQNLFTTISSDIDIIYSFNEQMEPENVFDYDLNVDLYKEIEDNLGYNEYFERSFIPIKDDIATYYYTYNFNDLNLDLSNLPGDWLYADPGVELVSDPDFDVERDVVLHIYSEERDAILYNSMVENQFTEQKKGTILFWWNVYRDAHSNGQAYIMLETKIGDSYYPALKLKVNQNKFWYSTINFNDQDTWTSIGDVPGTIDLEHYWTKHVIYFDCISNTFEWNVYADDSNYPIFNSNLPFYNASTTSINTMSVWSRLRHPDYYETYIDDIRYSWEYPGVKNQNSKKIEPDKEIAKIFNYSKPKDSGFYNDPSFGRNTLHFTLKNTINSPLFGRNLSGIIYADSRLNKVDLKFDVYPKDGIGKYETLSIGNILTEIDRQIITRNDDKVYTISNASSEIIDVTFRQGYIDDPYLFFGGKTDQGNAFLKVNDAIVYNFTTIETPFNIPITEADVISFDFNTSSEIYIDYLYIIDEGVIKSFLLEDPFIEGKNTNKYNPSILFDLNNYTESRFKNSALDDIQIPLVTPIELDFTGLNFEIVEKINIELFLNLNISLANRARDTKWSLRSRFIYFNSLEGKWEDFNGFLSARNSILTNPVRLWHPGSSNNPIDYIQNPNRNNFIPIKNSNDDLYLYPLSIRNITNDYLDGSKCLRMALISYIIPGFFETDQDGYFFSYERANPTIPIALRQEVSVNQISTSTRVKNKLHRTDLITELVNLTEQYPVNVSRLNGLPIGKIVSLSGIDVISDSLSEVYSIYDFQITDNKILDFSSENSPLFDLLRIEYVPQMDLLNNSLYPDFWYLPSSLNLSGEIYDKPYFVSDLQTDQHYYSKDIYRCIPDGYSFGYNEYGTYVFFDDLINQTTNPKASIYYSHLNNISLNYLSIKDSLLYGYDILNSPSELIGGSLFITIRSGMFNTFGAELSQIIANDYYTKIKFFSLDNNGILREIGEVNKNLDKRLLGLRTHELEIDLNNINYTTFGQQILGESLTKSLGYDLFITAETILTNAQVDGAIFKGDFVQQVLDASLAIKGHDSQQKFNGSTLSANYMNITQEWIKLTRIAEAKYQFNPESLNYQFDFDIFSLLAEDQLLIEGKDYIFDPNEKIINLINDFEEYAGLIFANISYKAFEWRKGYISSLKPMNFTFDGNYFDIYSKFIEFKVQFDPNGIPGYELENFDLTTGQTTLSSEAKGGELLNIYMFNYRKRIWEKVEYIFYEDFAESGDISYVIDRTVLTSNNKILEDFYNDLKNGKFEIQLIFTIESVIVDSFKSKMGFKIDSLDANIYYNPPNTEHSIKPEIIFDIDLTSYLKDTDVFIELIELELDYISSIIQNNPTLFTENAIIREEFNLFIQNNYLDFEEFNLNDDFISLSRDKLNNLIIRDLDNDKYIIRVKLQYDWTAFIEMNLNSQVEVLARLNLLNYKLKINYIPYSTSRISAFETESIFDLVLINTPNYFITDEGITLLPEDEDLDIGINSGFLRNVETHQRLMIRQNLKFNFSSNTIDYFPILLDTAYTDIILSFTNPVGYLEYPTSEFINNNTIFSFITDYEVVNVSLYYYDGVDNYISSLERKPNNRFEFVWNTIEADTGLTTGENISIMFNLTDILGNFNEYRYNFTCDFKNPEAYIIIGDNLNQDYQSDLIANPLTKITFISNEIGEEFYRIIDLELGQTTDWIMFNSSTINILSDLGELSNRFKIEYMVLDQANNQYTNSSYNSDLQFVRFSAKTSIIWTNDIIDLNSNIIRELTFQNDGQFGDTDNLQVKINGFNYGTAYLDGSIYRIGFDSSNSKESLLSYSDSLLNKEIFSNINPVNHINWEVRNHEYYGIVKHVLLDGDIVITNPLTYNVSKAIHINDVYYQNYYLPYFIRMQEVYYYNTSSETNETIQISFQDYFINDTGQVVWPDFSNIHSLIQNHSDQIKNGLIYFNYSASKIYDPFKGASADGFVIDFIMPSTSGIHTTIDKIVISFNDFIGNAFTKVYYDIDLRKYFLDDVKDYYEKTILGLGKMMSIPLYIDLNELRFSNPDVIFELRLIDSISISITDSEKWPGTFLTTSQDYSILNLPYQRVGIEDIRLYNLISDSIQEDQTGYIHSNIKLEAPDYYNYYAEESFKIKRIDLNLTDFKITYEGNEISGLANVEYSDFIEVYLKWNSSSDQIILNDINKIPIYLVNASDLEFISQANLYWISQDNQQSPTGFDKNYYYSKLEVPKFLDTFLLNFSSPGTPIHNVIVDLEQPLRLNVLQEDLSNFEPIYLTEKYYEIQYGDPIKLKGVILDNDNYIVEDEVYQYMYQEALDGTTIHKFKFSSPYLDEFYIDREEFALFYINEKMEKIPLFNNINEFGFINSSLLDEPPVINYVDNSFLLNIFWNTTDIDKYFIKYDTNLLLSYKMLKGRPIAPVSFSSVDDYNNDRQENLVEIPYSKFDMINNVWKTEDDFKEIFPVDTQLNVVNFSADSIIIQGPLYYDEELFRLGIINIDNVFKRENGTTFFRILTENEYSWFIDGNGFLHVEGLNYIEGDEFKVSYYTYNPLLLTHPLSSEVSELQYIRIRSSDNPSDVYEFSQSEFKVSNSGYKVYFYDLYNTILNDERFDQYSIIEVAYHAPFTRLTDLSINLILSLQDNTGNYIPIDNVPIDNLGFFDYEKTFSLDSAVSLPIDDKSLINLRLDYLPSNVFNKTSGLDITIPYNYEPEIGEIRNKYPYKESDKWFSNFKIKTIPEKVKIEMVEDPTQNLVINQEFVEERDYIFNYNPLEALEREEEFTALQIDAQAKEDYNFNFKLTDFSDHPINNSIVWMHIGFMPKSKTKFLNERAIIEDSGIPIYYESLGTEEISSIGPGEGSNKMFGKPLIYPGIDINAYGPYYWLYGLTNEFGEVDFDLNFDHDYLGDFAEIFGSVEGIKSIEDMTLYIRVFSSFFSWDDFKVFNPELYVCSKNGSVFNGSEILENYDVSQLALQDSTYAEGIIRLHRADIALGIGDYLTYDMKDLSNDILDDNPPKPLNINLYATEADPIPSSLTNSIESLIKQYDIKELEPQPESILSDNYYHYIKMEIINPSGHYALDYPLVKMIQNKAEGGVVQIKGTTMYEILPRLGPGLSTIKMQVMESDYYKASPIVSVPLEIRPPNWVRFGEKNLKIDLIDSYLNAWGSSFVGNDSMIFESNYPHLMGTIWIEPFFNATGAELSVQDYISVDLTASVIGSEGEISEFPLRNNIMLRPGNYDGLMRFDIGLGPEDAYLMNLDCNISLSFNIDYNILEIYENNRDVNIYLLDLRLEENPSSSNPKIIWSLYDESISPPGLSIELNELVPMKQVLEIGDNVNNKAFGIEETFIYKEGKKNYSIDTSSDLFNLIGLYSIAGLAIIGKKSGSVIDFVGDWTNLYTDPSINSLQELSTINFTGDTPDVGSEFSVIYEFIFDFSNNPFGLLSLGPSNQVNKSQILFEFSNGFLGKTENIVAPMYTRFIEMFDGSSSDYTLKYSVQNNNDINNIIIYNEEDLIKLGLTDKVISGDHLKIIFSNSPSIPFNVSYGIRSQYNLGYGFQKLNQRSSDSIRLIYNDSAIPAVIDETNVILNTIKTEDPSLYIGLEDTEIETILELYNVPLLYAPELNITFKLDSIILDQINKLGTFGELKFDIFFVSGTEFNSMYSDTISIPLDYNGLVESISGDGSY
ncbi:MAG: hypothetical protein ACXAC7_14040, partial [Candidatus Hodarchaeales archaeon]